MNREQKAKSKNVIITAGCLCESHLPSQDFQHFRNVVSVGQWIQDKLVEYIVHSLADEGSQLQELGVNAMKCRLQHVPLTRVFNIE